MSLADKEIIEESSQVFFSGTVLSRITGLLRDVITAYAFGSSAAIAALMVAFRFSSLLRRIFGEGAMHAAFVPAYEKKRIESDSVATRFFADLSLLISVTLLGLIFLGEVILGSLIYSHALSVENVQIAGLTMILLPSLLFICNGAFCSSLLQCHNVFFLPAVSPAVFNLFWIMGVICLKTQRIDLAVKKLSIWIFAGLVMQWAVLLPKVFTALKGQLSRHMHHFSYSRLKESLHTVAQPLLLGVVGVSTTQINSALDSVFARMMSLEGPAYLWYAIRIQQVPLALFGVATAGAILPPLARAFRRSEDEYIQLIHFSLSRGVGLLTPCIAALALLGPACVNLLYGRGAFDQVSATQTTYALWAYAIGLLPQGLVLILGPAFFVQNRYYRTTRASILTLGLNILLNTLFAFILQMPAWSVALSTSISSWFQAIYLFYYLRREIAFKKWRRFCLSSLQMIVVCIMSAYFAYYVAIKFHPSVSSLLYFPRQFKEQVILFGWQTSLFFIFLFGLASLFRVKEILALLRYLPGIKKKI